MFSYWFFPNLIPEDIFIGLQSLDNLPAKVSADYIGTEILQKFIALSKAGAFSFLTKRPALKIPVQVWLLSGMHFNNFQDTEDFFFPINII